MMNSYPVAPSLPVGIHVFERGWLSANNVLFTDGEQTTLIDSGYCTHSAQTLSLVASVLGNRSLDRLLNTHLHSDHCGGNAALQARYPELKTYIPPGQAAEVACWNPEALTYSPTGQLCPRYSFTHTLAPGSMLRLGTRDWHVHAAPGHDPHSLLFFEPEDRILVSADALWENGFGVVFPELDGEDAFDQVGATLTLIEQLKPVTVIPGHGRVFTYTPEALKRARDRLHYFVNNPAKHAQHAAKVLLKYKLLEVQQQPIEQFLHWALATPYFSHINDAFFPAQTLRTWIEAMMAELVQVGVAQTEGKEIMNA